jgi:hypothetical protein
MSYAFNPEETALISGALRQALSRLKSLGLVDGDATQASADLSKLMLQAVEAGERNEENLVLFAIGRYHPQVSEVCKHCGAG